MRVLTIDGVGGSIHIHRFSPLICISIHINVCNKNGIFQSILSKELLRFICLFKVLSHDFRAVECRNGRNITSSIDGIIPSGVELKIS